MDRFSLLIYNMQIIASSKEYKQARLILEVSEWIACFTATTAKFLRY